MHFNRVATVAMLALSFGAGGCGQKSEERQVIPTADTTHEPDRAAELQLKREQDLSKIDDRVASLERRYRDYQDKHVSRPLGTSGSKVTPRLRHDVQSDMDDVKKAVDHLRTTTPENWWERHESAIVTAFDEVESDVKRFASTRALPTPRKSPDVVADHAGQPVSNAPFTSTRDKFVADMHARAEAMNKMLDKMSATGARKTERDDLRARVKKLDDDIDGLKSASAEDWWNLSTARVNDYIERVEKSVARLDHNER